MLGSSGFDLASLVMGEGEETFATAATRVWAAGEALKKAGAVALPTMERLANGWVLFAAGEFRVATWAAAICGEPHVMAIARRPQGDTPAKSCQASPRSAEPAQATQPAYSYRHVVGFQDTNLVGNVYFVNHLEWQGRCREMFLRDEAPSVLEALKSSLALVTTSCACDYLVELEAFDTVRVDMRLVALEANRIELAFTYWREKPGTEELVAVGRQGLACLHVARGSRVAAPIPAALAEALRPYWPVKEAVGIAGRR